MQTKHHLIPKCWRHCEEFFLHGGKRGICRVVTEQDHKAWNVLTNMSQMNLEETAESLSRFIPLTHKFIVVEK